MCFVYTAALPDLAICAADTRWMYPEGPEDYGGKVRRVPGGWVTGTGATLIGLHGFRALQRVGLADPVESRAALDHGRGEAFRTALGSIDPEQAKLTRFHCVRETPAAPFELLRFSVEGEPADQRPGDTGMGNLVYETTWAGAEDLDPAMVNAAVASFAEEAGPDPVEVVRAAARLLDFAHVHGGYDMSRELEVGVSVRTPSGIGHFHLRAPLDWLITAEPDAIVERSGPAPRLAAFPDHPAERRMVLDSTIAA